MQSKHCSHCKQFLPVSAFTPTQPGKYRSHCRQCHAAKAREQRRLNGDHVRALKRAQRAKHRDRINARQREKYAESPGKRREASRQYWRSHVEAYRERARNRDKAAKSAYNRAYRLAHLEELSAYLAEYREQHRAEARAYSRRYNVEHSDKVRRWRVANRLKSRINSQNRRARKREIGGCYTEQDLQAQLKRQHNRCFYCKERFNQSRMATIDHVIPLSHPGSSNGPENIVMACRFCNLSKKDRLWRLV